MKSCIVTLFLSLVYSVGIAQKTADEVVGKVIEAQGGLTKLKSIQSIKQQGNIEFSGQKVPYNVYIIHDKILKVEFTFNGLTGYQLMAKDSGYQFSPFQGMTTPERMTAEDISQGLDNLDIQGVLIDYAQKGHTIELMEPEDVDGVDAIQLKVNLKSGKTLFYFIDPDTYYIIRTKVKGISNGQEYTNISNNYNFKATSNGVILPYTIDNITYDNIEVNVPIDQKIFEIKKTK
jgi:hypothetical protein